MFLEWTLLFCMLMSTIDWRNSVRTKYLTSLTLFIVPKKAIPKIVQYTRCKELRLVTVERFVHTNKYYVDQNAPPFLL